MSANRNSGRMAALFCRLDDAPALIRDSMRLRKRELVDGLGWNLVTYGEIERDEFDNDDAIYCIIREDAAVVGCFRAIRCDRPYLALSKFPDLAHHRPYPTHALAWEISRITVAADQRRFTTSMYLYAAMFHFGRLHDAVSLCGFVDLNHERLFARVGVASERYGEPTEIGRDRFGRPLVVVAGELPLRRQGGLRFEKLMSLTDQMEIEDATAILGRSRIPA